MTSLPESVAAVLCAGMDRDPPVIVDARGLRCPWPVLRLARALRDAALLDGSAIDLLSDDPAAAGEVAAFAAERGLVVAAITGGFRLTAP